MNVLRNIVLGVAIIGVVIGVFAQPAQAVEVDWINSPIYIRDSNDQTNLLERDCMTPHTFDYYWGDGSTSTMSRDSCIIDGADGWSYLFDYSAYDHVYNVGLDTAIAVYNPETTNHYKTLILPAGYEVKPTENSDILIGYTKTNKGRVSLDVYKDATDALKPIYTADERQIAAYSIDVTKADHYEFDSLISDAILSTNNRYLYIHHYTTSPTSGGFNRLDLSTGEMVSYALAINESFFTMYGGSDDGRYVLLSDNIYDLNKCFTKNDIGWRCESRSLVDYLRTHVTRGVDIESTRFVGDSIEAVLSYPDTEMNLMGGVRRSELSLTKKLTYLALGDSFSSGEGALDVDGTGYRVGTDVSGDDLRPTEKCHLSKYSYPYLIAGRNGYDDDDWSSVACSGAVIDDVNGEGSLAYEGQNNNDTPRLSKYDIYALKNEALIKFIPGRQKQIEFVREYQPNVVTIGVGGNDIAFAKIITACASPDTKGGGEWTTTCSYAKNDGTAGDLLSSIIDQFNRLESLYRELIAAGPKGMKLYVIGYPVFVDTEASNYQCGLGAQVRLNKDERSMIAAATRALNSQARLAAEYAGAIYVSTESSFGSHTLCGDALNSAMNGIVEGGAPESFHPNQLGHKLMADRIELALGGKTLVEYECVDSVYVVCPGGSVTNFVRPGFFENTPTINSRHSSSIVVDTLTAPSKFFINLFSDIADYTFGANNPLAVLIYSERRELGTYMTDENGELIRRCSCQAIPQKAITLLL